MGGGSKITKILIFNVHGNITVNVVVEKANNLAAVGDDLPTQLCRSSLNLVNARVWWIYRYMNYKPDIAPGNSVP